jgi:hypothetical protein
MHHGSILVVSVPFHAAPWASFSKPALASASPTTDAPYV